MAIALQGNPGGLHAQTDATYTGSSARRSSVAPGLRGGIPDMAQTIVQIPLSVPGWPNLAGARLLRPLEEWASR